jgi:RHH-type transcriptional regulator, rel operon repressor / antitoxin RelB
MAIAIRLPEELESKLSALAKRTKRSKSFYIREAVESYLEDVEDYYLGMDILENPGRIYSLEEARKACELDD